MIQNLNFYFIFYHKFKFFLVFKSEITLIFIYFVKICFIAKIYSVIERVVRLELFETENRNQSFNDLLISIGFAEKAEENIQSKLNHEHRRNAQLMRDNTRGLLRLEDTSDRKGVYNSEDVIEV